MSIYHQLRENLEELEALKGQKPGPDMDTILMARHSLSAEKSWRDRP